MMEKEELNLKQKKFCELYATDISFFGNGTQAYCEAYDIDFTDRKKYESARRNASRLLTNVDIFKYINNLLESEGLNDSNVDKQLLFLIEQHAELQTKLGAIREYNKLRQRIIEKHEIAVNDLPRNDGPIREYDRS